MYVLIISHWLVFAAVARDKTRTCLLCFVLGLLDCGPASSIGSSSGSSSTYQAQECSMPPPPPYPNDHNLGAPQSYPGPNPMSYSHAPDDFTDMRSRDTTWSATQLPPQSPRYPPQHGATYTVRQMSSAMPPSTGNYPGMFSRMMPPHVSQMSPQRQDKTGFFSPQSKLQVCTDKPLHC